MSAPHLDCPDSSSARLVPPPCAPIHGMRRGWLSVGGVGDGGVVGGGEDAFGLFDDDPGVQGLVQLLVQLSLLVQRGGVDQVAGGHVGQGLGDGIGSKGRHPRARSEGRMDGHAGHQTLVGARLAHPDRLTSAGAVALLMCNGGIAVGATGWAGLVAGGDVVSVRRLDVETVVLPRVLLTVTATRRQPYTTRRDGPDRHPRQPRDIRVMRRVPHRRRDSYRSPQLAARAKTPIPGRTGSICDRGIVALHHRGPNPKMAEDARLHSSVPPPRRNTDAGAPTAQALGGRAGGPVWVRVRWVLTGGPRTDMSRCPSWATQQHGTT